MVTYFSIVNDPFRRKRAETIMSGLSWPQEVSIVVHVAWSKGRDESSTSRRIITGASCEWSSLTYEVSAYDDDHMISSFVSLFAYFVIWVTLIFSQFHLSDPSPHILSWLSLAFLPLFLALLRYIQKESESPIFTPVRLGLISISLLCISYFFSLDIITFLLIAIAVVILSTHMDERILFALALVFLLGTVYALLIDDQATAERLSIFVYYSLVLGVSISLIGSSVSHLFDRLPSYRFPLWWQSYIDELMSLMSLMHHLLPLMIFGLLAWSISPWGYLVSFDTQFIGSLVLIYVISSLVMRPDDMTLQKWILPILSIFALMLTWWIFSSELSVRIGLIVMLLILGWVSYYRGEYVKTLAKKIVSL